MLQRYISQELTDLCSSKSGQIYATSYVGFSNVASRTGTNTAGTLTNDTLDHLTQWYEGSTNQEQYLYHASGQRMPRRFTNGNDCIPRRDMSVLFPLSYNGSNFLALLLYESRSRSG